MQGWIAFHIVSVVCWFAGLFYLPRLFVYHAMATEVIVKETLLKMEKKLYRTIMRFAMILTIISGLRLFLFYVEGGVPAWLWIKLCCVSLLIGFHHWCGRYINLFEQGLVMRSHYFFRWLNEIPSVLLVIIVCLVVLKPVL